jgi:hypothetical protein
MARGQGAEKERGAGRSKTIKVCVQVIIMLSIVESMIAAIHNVAVAIECIVVNVLMNVIEIL